MKGLKSTLSSQLETLQVFCINKERIQAHICTLILAHAKTMLITSNSRL